MINDVIGPEGLPAAVAKSDMVKSADMQDSQRAVPAIQSAPSAEPPAMDRKAIENAVAKIRESIGPLNSSLRIEIDPDIHRVIVKVLNDQSGEVIRQIPAQEMLEIAKRIDAMQGIFLTKRT